MFWQFLFMFKIDLIFIIDIFIGIPQINNNIFQVNFFIVVFINLLENLLQYQALSTISFVVSDFFPPCKHPLLLVLKHLTINWTIHSTNSSGRNEPWLDLECQCKTTKPTFWWCNFSNFRTQFNWKLKTHKTLCKTEGFMPKVSLFTLWEVFAVHWDWFSNSEFLAILETWKSICLRFYWTRAILMNFTS